MYQTEVGLHNYNSDSFSNFLENLKITCVNSNNSLKHYHVISDILVTCCITGVIFSIFGILVYRMFSKKCKRASLYFL